MDHTYGRSWKKRSEDTWRLTLTYPKIRIGDIIGFGTFWLVNTIINRVQFASNNTGRLLFRAEFLAPKDVLRLQVQEGDRPWKFGQGENSTSTHTAIGRRNRPRSSAGPSDQKISGRLKREGRGKGKGISKEIGVVQTTPHKYYRDRVKVSARSLPHLTHNRRSTSPPGHLEESNPPFRRVHKVSEGHCYTETEYPLR